MARNLDRQEEREKRRAILRKAEFEINIAEREVNEWKMHRRESPHTLGPVLENRTRTLSDILCSTPKDYGIAPDISNTYELAGLEGRIRDLEEIRKMESEKHRKEIERLEQLIDNIQDTRRNNQDRSGLEKALAKKDKEICELKEKVKKEEGMRAARGKAATNRSSSQNSFENPKKQKPGVPRGLNTANRSGENKKSDMDMVYWKTKAYELTTKYFTALKSLRVDLEKLREDCTNEWKVFRQTYQNAIKQINNSQRFKG